MARAEPAKRGSRTPELIVLLSVFLLIGLYRGAVADVLGLPYPGAESYTQFRELDGDQLIVAARAVNSSVNGACLRDNLAPAVDLTIGGASSGPRTLNQYDCLVYGFTVQPAALGDNDIVFTITSPSSPTPRYTTWRFYREEITLARNDDTFDLTSAGLSFVMPNCMAKLTRRWVFTLTSTETYPVNLATAYGRHYAAAPADEIELDGVTDFVGTWTTTNAWQVFKFNSDSVLATQSATLNFASSTSEMTIYTQIGACPTMRYTYRYSVIKPDSTEAQKSVAVSNTDSVVYMAVAPLAEGYSGTGDITLGYSLEPSVCRELPTSLPFCSQVYWPTVGNDSQAHVRTRDDSAKTFYDDTVLDYPKINSDCRRVFKDFICLTTVAPPCRLESKKGIPLCQEWCDMVYSSCPTRFVSQVLQAELRDWCLRPGAEIRDTKAQSKIKPPTNCFHSPIPDPIDIWDFTERPMRNPLMWTLVGFGAYMAAALSLALIAVAVFIHMECKRRKQKRLTTALQQLGLALD